MLKTLFFNCFTSFLVEKHLKTRKNVWKWQTGIATRVLVRNPQKLVKIHTIELVLNWNLNGRLWKMLTSFTWNIYQTLSFAKLGLLNNDNALFHFWLTEAFFSLPSSGISSCVRPADTVMCLRHLAQPCYVALGSRAYPDELRASSIGFIYPRNQGFTHALHA